jgi:hypothetical protein
MRILNKEVFKAGYPCELDQDDLDYIEEDDYSGDEEYYDSDPEWYPPMLYL